MIKRNRFVGYFVLPMLIIPKCAVAFTVKDAQKGVLMRVRCVLLFAGLVFANLPAMVLAQSSSCPGIHINILDIRNSRGTLACALFQSSAGFPKEYLRHATSVMAVEIRDTQAGCEFVGIPPGTYALAVVHDENRNGKLDTNWLGVPTEGYGFSSDAKATLRAPSFSAASFRYDGGILDLTISLHY
jgi:uncharacterized protein (DUF2141 family)